MMIEGGRPVAACPVKRGRNGIEAKVNDAHSAAAARYPTLNHYVAGDWIEAGRRAEQAVIDPTTGLELGRVPLADGDDLDKAIRSAGDAFQPWRRVPALDRSRYLRDIAQILRGWRDEWAELIALELGKPLSEALREADIACEMFEWAAEEARRLYGRTIPARSPRLRIMTISEPVGPVAAICGWNAPAITPARKISAALAAGCTIVVKPSEATPATALLLARACAAASLPAGVVNIIFGDPPQLGNRFASDPAIAAISFTGGTEVGKRLSAIAGGTLKRAVFELGGHAPVLVFEDSDVEGVAQACAIAKYRNSGQICTSPTRLLVQSQCVDRFTESLVAAVRAWQVGDPFEPGVQMGPLQNARRRDTISAFVADARMQGATLLAGGEQIEGDGFFYRPTLLGDVPASALIRHQEPFGPLAAILPFDDVDDAIAQANELPFGLAAYAFTNDLRIAERLSKEIEAGTLAINHWSASFPETPFGGVKDSGVGSEGGLEGVAAFQQVRLVSVGSH